MNEMREGKKEGRKIIILPKGEVSSLELVRPLFIQMWQIGCFRARSSV